MHSMRQEADMLQPITHPDESLAPTSEPRLPALVRALRVWLLGFWASQCRHAERPERFVPRY
jgi:hypothetical protein